MGVLISPLRGQNSDFVPTPHPYPQPFPQPLTHTFPCNRAHVVPLPANTSSLYPDVPTFPLPVVPITLCLCIQVDLHRSLVLIQVLTSQMIYIGPWA